jgi:hypothetical protein
MNLKLVGYAFMRPDFSARIHIETKWIDKAKAPKGEKTRPPAMIASYCPFCGKPYPVAKKEEEVE